MKNILTIGGHTPQVHDSAWIAPNAIVTGNVLIGEESSVWYHTVIRGDVNQIRIGSHSNIQDACMVHGSTGGIDTVIGNNVTIGHRAIIHGCVIEDEVLIGMGAIILDEVVIPKHTIIAAGAVVTSGSKLKSGFIYAGVPAQKVKMLSAKHIENYILKGAESYAHHKEEYRIAHLKHK